MKRSPLLTSAIYGFLTGLVLLALSYLGNAWFLLPFLPFDLFDWLTRHLPGSIIEAGIRSMVSIIIALHLGPTDTTAKLAEQIQALGVVLVTGIIFSLILAWIERRRPTQVRSAGIWGGVVLWLGNVIVEFSLPQLGANLWVGLVWLFVLLTGWGWVLASLIVLIFGLGKYNRAKSTASLPATNSVPSLPPLQLIPFGPDATSGPAASPSQAVLAKRIEPAPGTRAEITPVDNFYRIDINTLPPVVDAASWRFQLKGMVQKPLTLSLAEIQSRPAFSQAVTLSCISNSVGGDLISTNYWTGVRFKDILAEAGLNPTVKYINVMAYDGFYESIPIEEAMDERILLAYAMNGLLLPNEHGFPLLVFIPNHYGMKQPKWRRPICPAPVIGSSAAGA
jgi:hypothetical protein